MGFLSIFCIFLFLVIAKPEFFNKKSDALIESEKRETKRKHELYAAIMQATYRAIRESSKQEPSNIDKRISLEKKLTDSFREELARENKMEVSELITIVVEGNVDGWRKPQGAWLIGKRDYLKQLNDMNKDLGSFDSRDYTTSSSTLNEAITIFSDCANIIAVGKTHDLTKEEKILLRKFKARVISLQRKTFPKLRDSYGPILRKILWEHDLSAKTFGKGYKVIQFVGSDFAANRNIKKFQQGVDSILLKLRFTQSRYKWFDYASEYTQYSLSSKKDSALVIWIGDIGREIE